VPQPAPPTPSSPARRRWALALLATLAAVAVAALAQRALPALSARLFAPTGPAEWIWRRQDKTDKSPTAFYAGRDFELREPPARARLLVTADEAYAVYLNGRRVGVGAWKPEEPLDLYEVGDLLLPGGNRLLAELRSSRGAGGFLALLVDGDTGEPIVWTDPAWRIVRRHQLGLVRGWVPLPADETASSWGPPPTGRWGMPRPGEPRAPFFLATGEPVGPPSRGDRGGGLGEGAGGEGSRLLVDFGREVVGHLALDLPPRDELGLSLLFVGTEEPPDPVEEPPATAVVVAPGLRRWIDARPRRFRWVLLVGVDRPVAVRLYPVDAETAARVGAAEPPASRRGVFGIDSPPPLRTPVEDEIWSEQ
jgi:hypothetical protein